MFAVAAGLIIYLALAGGGYDIVVRQGTALVAWSLLALGFALGLLPRSRPPRILLFPAIALAGLLLWMLLSLTWSESAERTTAEISRLLGYAGVMALAVAALNRHTFRAAAAGLSLGAVVVIVLAVASRLDPSAFPGATDVARQFRADRLDYPLDYWNAVGAWGAMTAAICVAWSAHARLAVTRALALAVVPVAGLAVYLSYSRGGVLASIVALVAVVGLSRNRWTAFVHALAAASGAALVILVARQHHEIAHATGGAGGGAVVAALLGAAVLAAGAVLLTSVMRADRARLPRETAIWAVPVFVAAVLIIGIVAGGGAISRGWHDFENKDQAASGPDPAKRLTSTGGNRHNLWDSAIAAWKAHPLDGTGPGTFEFWHERDARDPEFVRDAHSLYLESLAEMGLPGLLLLVGFLGGSLGLALYGRRKLTGDSDIGAHVAMCSAFVVFLFSAGVDWMWEETAIGVLALGGIAIAVAGGSARLRRRRRRGPISHPGVRVAVVVLALAAAAFEVPGLVSTQRLRDSQAAFRAGDYASAHQLAQESIDAEPWAASSHAQLAYVLERQGELKAARTEAESASSNEPTNWRWPLLLAPLQARLGDRAAARRTFSDGRALAPLLPFYSPLSSYGRRVYTVPQLTAIVHRAQARARTPGSP